MKKPALITLICTLFWGVSFAQSGKHAFGFMVRPAWSDVSQDIVNLSNQSGDFAFSIGILYNYKLARKLELQGGLAFSTLTERYFSRKLRWGSEHDGMGGWAGPDPNLPHELEMNYNYYFLDISAGLKIYFNESRFRFYAFPYSETNVYLLGQNNTELIYVNGSTIVDNLIDNKAPNVRNPNISLGLGLGMDVILGPKIKVFVLPSYEHMLFSMGERVDTVQEPRFFNAGVALGILYHPRGF